MNLQEIIGIGLGEIATFALFAGLVISVLNHVRKGWIKDRNSQ